MKRREFVQYSLASGVLFIAGPTDLVQLANATITNYRSRAFGAQSESEALVSLFGRSNTTHSGSFTLSAPMQSHGGAVPIIVTGQIKNVEGIAIFNEDNTYPLTSYLKTANAGCYYQTSIDIYRTSTITACVNANGAVYRSTARVKITKGAYGIHGTPTHQSKTNYRSTKTRLRSRQNPGGGIDVLALIGYETQPTSEAPHNTGGNSGHSVITNIQFYHNNRLAAEAISNSSTISRSPIGISLPEARPGDSVKVQWSDDQGRFDSERMTIK